MLSGLLYSWANWFRKVDFDVGVATLYLYRGYGMV